MGGTAKTLQPALVYSSLMSGQQLLIFLPFAKYAQCALKARNSIVSLQQWAQVEIPGF